MEIRFGQQATKVKQLADAIGRAISTGCYGPGNALPSINRLSRDYNVSRDTVFKAFIDLKERGLIDSVPGKGYYIVNSQKKILLLLDEYSPFKETLYNSFIKRLSAGYQVDLWFHQYNEDLFNALLRESLGRYNKYLVMNFDNEKRSPLFDNLDPANVLLLDFGKFDKKDYAYICQDFDEAFYNALSHLRDKLQKYDKLVLIFVKGTKHPQGTRDCFCRFCQDNGFGYEVTDDPDAIKVTRGEAYIAIRQTEVVSVIKKSRTEKLTCGTDFGLLAYNETPAYEVIDKGITALSIDWEQMGRLAAGFVVSGRPVRTYLPTEIRVRGSL